MNIKSYKKFNEDKYPYPDEIFEEEEEIDYYFQNLNKDEIIEILLATTNFEKEDLQRLTLKGLEKVWKCLEIVDVLDKNKEN